MSQLALGTVQFGLDYGITNSAGQLSDDVIVEMVRIAHGAGISLFDTAADYGSSQERLGKLVPAHVAQKYVTKFSLPADGVQPTAENLYLASMAKLKIKNLHAVLFHRLSDLTDERCTKTLNLLREARANGVVSRIGVSVYNADDLTQALEVFADLDFVQLPANILDLRLLESIDISWLRERGAEIHVRSVFLQGLLLARPEVLPPFFDELRPALRMIQDCAREQSVSVLALLLGALRQHPIVDAVVVGATSVAELNDITRAWNTGGTLEHPQLPDVPAALLDPRNWPAVRLLS